MKNNDFRPEAEALWTRVSSRQPHEIIAAVSTAISDGYILGWKDSRGLAAEPWEAISDDASKVIHAGAAIAELALALRSIGEAIMRAATINAECARDLAARPSAEVPAVFSGFEGLIDRLEKMDVKKPRKARRR